MIPNLTKEGKVALEKMARDGSEKASASLSSLIKKEISVQTIFAQALPLERIADTLGDPTELVTTIMMDVSGGANGSILLIYPKQSALNIVDLLEKRPLGTTTELSVLDESALRESGNIISGSFLAALSDYLQINMVESVPDIATDMLKATIDLAISRFAYEQASEAIALEIDFAMGTKDRAAQGIKAHFVLFLDEISARKLFVKLKKISGGDAMMN
jgi:chemotaxis protein CheC